MTRHLRRAPVTLFGALALFLAAAIPAYPATQLQFPQEISSVVVREAHARKVPLSLVWVVGYCESAWVPGSFNYNADGSFDVGYFQLNSTCHDYFGWKFGIEGFDPYDPEHNAMAAIRYLAHLRKSFGSWDLVLLAYNVGPSLSRAGPATIAMAAYRYRMYLDLEFDDRPKGLGRPVEEA